MQFEHNMTDCTRIAQRPRELTAALFNIWGKKSLQNGEDDNIKSLDV
jgi:hypothetical protein